MEYANPELLELMERLQLAGRLLIALPVMGLPVAVVAHIAIAAFRR